MTKSYSTAAKKFNTATATEKSRNNNSRHSSLEQNLSDDNNNQDNTTTIEKEKNEKEKKKEKNVVEIAGEVYSLDTKSNNSTISEKVEDVHDIIAKKRQDKISKKSTNSPSSSSHSKKFKTMDGNKFFKQYKPKYQRYDYARRIVKIKST